MTNPRLKAYKKMLRKTYKDIRETEEKRLLDIYEDNKKFFKEKIKEMS